MNQETLFKPLTNQSKAAVVDTVNALSAWTNEKNIPLHLQRAIWEYYEQLVKLANESSQIEREIQEQLAKDFEEEEQQNDNRITGPVTKSDV